MLTRLFSICILLFLFLPFADVFLGTEDRGAALFGENSAFLEQNPTQRRLIYASYR